MSSINVPTIADMSDDVLVKGRNSKEPLFHISERCRNARRARNTQWKDPSLLYDDMEMCEHCYEQYYQR